MGLTESKSEKNKEKDYRTRTSVSLFAVPNRYTSDTKQGSGAGQQSPQKELEGLSVFCDLCFRMGLSDKATKFCDTCNSYLCQTCFKQHGYPNCLTSKSNNQKSSKLEKKCVSFDLSVSLDYTAEKDDPIDLDLVLSGKLQKDCKFSVKVTEEKKEPWICGAVAPSDEQLILVDGRNWSVKIVDSLAQKVTSSLQLESDPFDICALSKHEVAVTLPEIQRIQMMTILNGLALTRRMKVKGHCFGITQRNDLLGVTYLCPEKVEVITLNGQVLHRIRPDKGDTDILNMPYYITFSLSGKSMYVSDNRNNSVTRLSHTGEIMSTYKDGSLVHPESVVVLEDGSLLVVSRDTNCIHHVSEHCEKKKIILTRKNGLKLPWAICYQHRKSAMYVSNNEGQYMSCFGVPLAAVKSGDKKVDIS